MAVQSRAEGRYSHQPDEFRIHLYHPSYGYGQAIHLVAVSSRWIRGECRLGYRVDVVLSVPRLAGQEDDPGLWRLESLSRRHIAISGIHTRAIFHGQFMERHWSDPR